MNFFVKKVILQKSSNICLTIVLQLIICYLKVCKSNEFNDQLRVQDSAPNKYRSDPFFDIQKNFSLKYESHLDKEMMKGLPIRQGMVQFSSKKPQLLPKVRTKRSKRRTGVNGKFMSELVQDVCPSVSDWVARPEALDPYGNRLTVVQRIPINGTVINQYFYETFCSHSLDFYAYDYSTPLQNFNNHINSQCRGIDKKIWNSRCRENYIWTYGKVVTSSGDIGWSVIAIRGSCGCAIWPKSNELAIGRGRRVSPKQVNREDNHLLTDPFF